MSLEELYERCWHPVCSVDELAANAPHPLAVTLLGRRLAVAQLGPATIAMTDRCPHRSTRLSVGWVDGTTIRCAYHGWRFQGGGRCVEIPAMPDGPIPGRARLETFDAEVAYGLVWVRIDGSAHTEIPTCRAFGDASMRVVAGAPYTWPTSAARRVENFVDLAHFPSVHDGTLGRSDRPVPPVPEVWREAGELCFDYNPPELDTAAEALTGPQQYRMPMPLTVDIAFTLPTGAHRRLWMTASPVDVGVCRSFWFVSRDDDVDGDDAAHLAFQQIILDEDAPVVCNQDPPELPLDPGTEVSIRTDRVSIEYRRWLGELAHAAPDPKALRTALTQP